MQGKHTVVEEEKRKEKDTRKRVKFTWTEGDPSHVLIAGTFNKWQAIALSRTPSPPENQENLGNLGCCFVTTIPLDIGSYQYKYIVDGDWKCDYRETMTFDNDGNLNNIIHVGKGTGKGKDQSKQEKEQKKQKQPQQQKSTANNNNNNNTKNQPKKQQQVANGGDSAAVNDDNTDMGVVESTTNTTTKSTTKVNPWEVEAGEDGVDYEFLIKDFGTQRIEAGILKRFEKITGHPPHPWLRRGLFFSHRSLDEILDLAEKKKPFYLYTGRGPSSEALHLGHMVPFVFTKWLQDVFDVPLVIQLTDDEKFLWKGITLETARRLAIENAKDIIAVGFDINKTFIFRDTDYIGTMYDNILKIQRLITANQVKAIFGFDGSSNIGKYMYPAIQAAPSFSSSFPHIFGKNSDVPCLIPCAIDQDPFFRMTRDVAPRLHLQKPAVVHSKFFPALQGSKTRMSATSVVTAIFMTDSPNEIEDKIRLHAFSGGCDTEKEHRKKGGDLTRDVPYQYLNVFEFNDENMNRIGKEFSTGRMLSGEIKKELVNVLVPFVKKHQEARKHVTDDVVYQYMKVRPLKFANQ